MARPGEVLDIPTLGVRIEFRTTTEESGGELVEFDLVGRPRGFITLPHVHPEQSERHEVIEGRFAIRTGALERLLGPGEIVETPAGTEHRHGSGENARIRVQVRPAKRFEAWIERIAAMDRDGELLASGFPKPVAAARLLLDFDGEAHATTPPLRVQRAVARATLRLAAAQSRR
jgi:quercetin dioxygenase-like cupin family protein